MKTVDLLKSLAVERPELIAQLEPSEGDRAYVLYRGVKYVGIFSRLFISSGKMFAVMDLTDPSQTSPYNHRSIPIVGIDQALVSLDPIEGVFAVTLDDRYPCNGDPAFTMYGCEYVGVLSLDGCHSHMLHGAVVPADKGKSFGIHPHNRGVFVGYNGCIEWDEERGMYFAPADPD